MFPLEVSKRILNAANDVRPHIKGLIAFIKGMNRCFFSSHPYSPSFPPPFFLITLSLCSCSALLSPPLTLFPAFNSGQKSAGTLLETTRQFLVGTYLLFNNCHIASQVRHLHPPPSLPSSYPNFFFSLPLDSLFSSLILKDGCCQSNRSEVPRTLFRTRESFRKHAHAFANLPPCEQFAELYINVYVCPSCASFEDGGYGTEYQAD